MVKRHLKRILVPKFWKVPKKTRKWTVRPRPGPHKLFNSIPLLVLVRDIFGLADSMKDAKKIIKRKEISIDGKSRTDVKYPVGLMDVVEISKTKKFYRIIPTSKGLEPIEIPEGESDLKLARINGKKNVRGGNVQLHLHDGKNLLINIKDPKKPKEDVYTTGDSILINLSTKKILNHIKMKKGNIGLITGGQNIGRIVKIKKVVTTRSREPNKVFCEEDGEEFVAIKDYVFMIGNEKPVVKIKG